MALYRNSSGSLAASSVYARIGGSVKALTQLYCRVAGRNMPLLSQMRNGSIAMLFNSAYQNDEATNLQASLLRLGKTGVLEFSDVSASGLSNALSGRQILLVPEPESGDLFGALSEPARQVIINFVLGGGHLITFYSTPSTIALLNLFGLGAANSGVSSPHNVLNPSVSSPFRSGVLPAVIGQLNATQSLRFSNVGAANSSQFIYFDASGHPAVASFVFSSGRVSYLGWDWFGPSDSNWESVLLEVLNA